MIELAFQLRRGDFHLRVDACIESPVTAIVGGSGAGKSSLLSTIAGVLVPQSGRIVINGETLFDAEAGCCVPPARRRIGLVFQSGQLFPHLTVEQNLRYGYQNRTPDERRFSPAAVAAHLQITPLMKRYPRHLSGGEQQRVALGRAILYAPRLLLLDEPLSSLDDELKSEILPVLRRLHDEYGIPMLYVTHARDEVDALGCPAWRMQDGRLLPAPPAMPSPRF